MLKNISRLEVIIENKVCQFMCDMDTPLPIVKEALFQFLKYIGQIEDAAKASKDQQQKIEEPESIEESKIEGINE